MIRVVVAIAIAIAYTPRADACSCSKIPSPCEAYHAEPIIFIGTATAIARSADPNEEDRVTFAVTERFKGTVDDTAIVEGSGACGFTFQKGKAYIVYASNSGGQLYAGTCSRTALTNEAREDIAYARSFHKRTLAFLDGYVRVDDEQSTIRAGIEVRVRDTKHRTRTDKDGRYKLELPPGNHTLEVVDPKTIASTETVTLVDKSSCMRRNLVVVWNGRVRGRVLGVDGKPAANVQLTLFGIGATRTGHRFATTDKTGKYEFTGLPTGDYAVVAYSTKGVPTTTFYPNAPDSAKSKSIKLSQAGVVQLADLKLLP